MTMEFLGVPSSIADVVWLVVQSLIILVVIVVSDHIIAHGVGIKHALIMSFGAYFLVPLILFGMMFSGFVLPYVGFIIPLIVWIILGEVLLEGDMKDKAIVGVIAYVAYLALAFSGLQGVVTSVVPI